MTKRVLAGAMVVTCLLAASLWAKQGIVKTKDGLIYEGDVTEKDDRITIKTKSGIETGIDRRLVEEITYAENVQAQFDERMAKLAENDVEGRIALARWAY